MRHAYDVREAAAGTVRLVDRLAEARLVERKTGSDRRSVSLRLTEAGKRQVRSLLVGRQHAVPQALRGLDDWERSALSAIASKVLRAWSKARSTAIAAAACATMRPARTRPVR